MQPSSVFFFAWHHTLFRAFESIHKDRPRREFRLRRISGGLPSLCCRADALRRRCEPAPLRFARGVDSCSAQCIKKASARMGRGFFGTRNGNRTHNYPLGGGYYIHLTMQACYLIVFFAWVYKGCTKLRLAGLGHKILVVFEHIQIVFRSIFSDRLTP